MAAVGASLNPNEVLSLVVVVQVGQQPDNCVSCSSLCLCCYSDDRAPWHGYPLLAGKIDTVDEAESTALLVIAKLRSEHFHLKWKQSSALASNHCGRSKNNNVISPYHISIIMVSIMVFMHPGVHLTSVIRKLAHSRELLQHLFRNQRANVAQWVSALIKYQVRMLGNFLKKCFPTRILLLLQIWNLKNHSH